MKHPELADKIRDVFPAVVALEQPGVTVDAAPATERIGAVIGRYKLLEVNGRSWLWVKLAAYTDVNQPLIQYYDLTGDPRLMAHLNDCVIDPGPPMVARLTYRFQPKANLGRGA